MALQAYSSAKEKM